MQRCMRMRSLGLTGIGWGWEKGKPSIAVSEFLCCYIGGDVGLTDVLIVNLGKWVLSNLFAGKPNTSCLCASIYNSPAEFIRAEMALSAELMVPTPRATASGLPPAMAIPSLPSVTEGQSTAPEDGIYSTPASPRPAPSSPALTPSTPLALGSKLEPIRPFHSPNYTHPPRSTACRAA
jgi:hypothetical protein